VLLTEIVEWIGKPVLLQFCFNFYLSFTSELAKRRSLLRKRILEDQKLLKQTSAQDQFAKWAKLRRQVDKGLADLEKLNAEVATQQASFAIRFNTVIWFFTAGLQFFIGWWYRKQAVFYLPKGWFGPAEWWLALPFAPKGSVSCATWQMACRRTIKSVETVVRQAVIEPLVVKAAMQTSVPSEKSERNGVKT